ncbi:MAG: response regulator [Aliidongia sp.]
MSRPMTKNVLRRVLLIEDNLGDVSLLRAMLWEQAQNNTELTHVGSMGAAETYLATRPTDLILLDLGLPDAAGLEAVRRAHAAAPRVPMVVLTGSDDETLAVHALQEGAQEYLVKGQIETRGLLRSLHYAAERKVMEDTLFAEIERAQVTLNSIGDEVICTDLAGNITFLNLVAENLTGWPLDTAEGRPVSEVLQLIDATSRAPIANPVEMAVGQNRTVPLPPDCVRVRQNGAEVALEGCVSPIHDREGTISGAVIVFRDVTERIRAHRDSAENKRIYEDLFNNSDAAIVDTDLSGLFRLVQSLKRQGVRELRGYVAALEERRGELIGTICMNGANAAALRMHAVSSPDEIEQQSDIIVDIAEAMFRGEESIQRSAYLTANGALIPVIYSLRIPQTADDGRRVPMIIIDLSDVRLAEAARQATIAKSQFLSSMSHEIRTPLNGVIGNLELLALTSLDSEQVDLIDDATKAAKALLGLVGNILDFSKIEAGKLTTEMGELNPAALVEEAADILQSRARQKGIFIAATFAPDLPSLVRGDAMRLRQILLNLIGNAVKFTDKGGVRVNLSVGRWAMDTCELRFDVHDTGRGFDAKLKARLFEPFTQDSGPIDGVEGTGLGLSICKSLVELFGGTIGCKAVPGEGASFWFILPVEVVQRAAPTACPDLSDVSVVFIGRHDRAENSLKTYLKDRGAKVATESGRTLLGFARQQGIGDAPKVDVAVLDADREADDCEDTTAAIARLREERIVPLLYGANQPVFARLRQGFAAVIQPDMSFEYLDRNIRLLIGHVQVRNRLAAQQAAIVSDFGPAAISGARVLVLEDRVINQTVIRKQLLKLGIKAALAMDGVKGLEALDHQNFDLILCDCSMPEMNGYDFTRRLRRREAAKGDGRRMPVIALTANAFREDAEKCFEAGMDDFMSKPVTMDRLAAMLLRWLAPSCSAEPAGGQTDSGPPVMVPMIDLAALAKILGTDEPGALTLVLRDFMAVMDTSLSEVEAAIMSGDSGIIRAAAHGAKGEARCAAATALADLYTELENMAAADDPAVLRRLVARAATEIRRVQEFIRGLVEDRPPESTL